MVDDPSSKASENKPTTPAETTRPAYDWLRWTIRITGIVLMVGGTIYLGVVASDVLTGGESGDTLMVVIVSLVMLGLGILVLRTGIRMLRTIDAHTIGTFSFLFALIYTWILVQILPLSGLFTDHPVFLYLLMFLYFGLSHWILKRILLHLLLPRSER